MHALPIIAGNAVCDYNDVRSMPAEAAHVLAWLVTELSDSAGATPEIEAAARAPRSAASSSSSASPAGQGLGIINQGLYRFILLRV